MLEEIVNFNVHLRQSQRATSFARLLREPLISNLRLVAHTSTLLIGNHLVQAASRRPLSHDQTLDCVDSTRLDLALLLRAANVGMTSTVSGTATAGVARLCEAASERRDYAPPSRSIHSTSSLHPSHTHHRQSRSRNALALLEGSRVTSAPPLTGPHERSQSRSRLET